ncbi:hypothetical protein WR25_05667 [Diploscapter pachys]|uniref:Uncharacterized protein n=1 Tax=Diploscapter pachys TaxID=2018661 RepID=A0A2A2JYG3_9BILA|nr:hypothetical protein WR25_05667 [Diploscapter pachys]
MAQQQAEEEGRADQRHGDAEPDLACAGCEAAEAVGDQHQRRAAEAARQQQRGWAMAEDGAQQVRHDESDETDHAGRRNACADAEAGAEHDQRLDATEPDAERTGGALPQRQRVERGAGRRQQDGADDQKGRGTSEVGEAAVGERAHQPVEHACDRIGVWCDRDEEGGERAGKARQDRAGEDEGDRVRVAPGERDKQQHRRDRGAHRRGEDAEAGRAGIEDRRDRAEGGGGRDADHGGVGERVAQEALQHCPRHAEHRPEQKPEQRAWQAQFEEDRGGGVAAPGQPLLAGDQRQREAGDDERGKACEAEPAAHDSSCARIADRRRSAGTMVGPPQFIRCRGNRTSATCAPLRARMRRRNSAVRPSPSLRISAGGCATMVSIGSVPVKARP